jgi:hypothetical protein
MLTAGDHFIAFLEGLYGYVPLLPRVSIDFCQ